MLQPEDLGRSMTSSPDVASLEAEMKTVRHRTEDLCNTRMDANRRGTHRTRKILGALTEGARAGRSDQHLDDARVLCMLLAGGKPRLAQKNRLAQSDRISITAQG